MTFLIIKINAKFHSLPFSQVRLNTNRDATRKSKKSEADDFYDYYHQTTQPPSVKVKRECP